MHTSCHRERALSTWAFGVALRLPSILNLLRKLERAYKILSLHSCYFKTTSLNPMTMQRSPIRWDQPFAVSTSGSSSFSSASSHHSSKTLNLRLCFWLPGTSRSPNLAQNTKEASHKSQIGPRLESGLERCPASGTWAIFVAGSKPFSFSRGAHQL